MQATDQTPQGLFYLVGLLAALHVLGSVVSILRGFEGIIIDCPRFVPESNGHKSGRAAAPLNHLLAMYPQIKGPDLEDYVAEVMLNAKAVRPKKSALKVLDVSNSDLDLCVRKLGAVIVTETDNNLSHVADQSDQTAEHVFGVPNRLVYQFAEKRLNVSRSLASAAIDRLIDEAYLVTKVEKTQREAKRWGRTFEPDGELASSRIRRFIAEHHPVLR